MSECSCSCVCVAIEQHSRKFYGLIVWSLVTFLTFPECWTIDGCSTKFSCNYFCFRVCYCQSERLSLLVWTFISLILISSNGNICYSFWWLFHSIWVSVFVCLLCDLDYFFQFTICTRLNWLFLPFAGFVLFRAFWFKSRVFRFWENLVIKDTS